MLQGQSKYLQNAEYLQKEKQPVKQGKLHEGEKNV